MDAAAQWLRDNDPEYKKQKAVKKRKSDRQRVAALEGNKNRSLSKRQMRGVVRENLDGKQIAPSRGASRRGPQK